jgi:protein SCO1/2
LVLFLLAAVAPEVRAQDAPAPGLPDVGIDQRLNESVPPELLFLDESGKAVRLGDYFDSKPVILVLAYYRCPMLCTQVINGLVESLRGIPFDAGKQFQVVVVSFDPREQPELAAAKKASYVESYGRPGAENGWHFLTGEEEPIRQLTRAVGFRYAYDPKQDQFAHASGLVILTPQGKIAHYFYGIDFSPRDLRLALVESSEGKVGSAVDRVLLLCFHYDPATGKYAATAMAFVRLGGLLVVVILAVVLGRAWYRDWRKRQLGSWKALESVSHSRGDVRGATSSPPLRERGGKAGCAWSAGERA